MKYIRSIFVFIKTRRVKFVLTIFCGLIQFYSFSQISNDEVAFLSRLTPSSSLPEKLLDTKSVIFYSYTLTDKELQSIQETCQRTGIDVVAYYETDELLAGRDVTYAFARQLNSREITNLLFFQKSEKGYKTHITEFNTKGTIVEQNQYAWIAEDASLAELLKKIYRTSGGGLKRSNMLINDIPEKDIEIDPITGRRSEFFAIDLKVDELVIRWTGDAVIDTILQQTFRTYPFKYKFSEPGISEIELRKKGSMYLLCYLHTRGEVAKKLLGYDMSKSESALASITYPDSGQTQLKNIPSEMLVYKFYFKHIDSGNVFLGTKWDADLTFEQALKNHYRAFKTELRIN
jgi:hypothetical protein